MVVAISGLGTAGADELLIRDLRVDFFPLMAEDGRYDGSVSLSAPATPSEEYSGNIGGSGRYQSHSRVGLSYHHGLRPLESGRGSLVLGIAGALDRAETVAGSDKESWVVDGYVGWAWALTPRWHIEQGAIVGGGVGRWDMKILNAFSDDTTAADEDRVPIYEYGIRLAVLGTFAGSWQIGIEGRYLITTGSFEGRDAHVVSGNDETFRWQVDDTIEGFAIGLSAGFRF